MTLGNNASGPSFLQSEASCPQSEATFPTRGASCRPNGASKISYGASKISYGASKISYGASAGLNSRENSTLRSLRTRTLPPSGCRSPVWRGRSGCRECRKCSNFSVEQYIRRQFCRALNPAALIQSHLAALLLCPRVVVVRQLLAVGRDPAPIVRSSNSRQADRRQQQRKQQECEDICFHGSKVTKKLLIPLSNLQKYIK